MSGARPKDYTRRFSHGSSHEDTGALCTHGNSELAQEELAISSRDAQANQDDLQLSLAGEHTGIVVHGTGQVGGKGNAILQQGDNSEMTINTPLVVENHVHFTQYADGTKVRPNNDYDVPGHQAHPEAFEGLDDLVNLAIGTTHHASTTRVHTPKLPSAEQLDWLKWHLKRLYRTKLAEFQPLPWFDDLHLQLKDVYTNLQVVRKDRADRDLPLRRLKRGEIEKRSSNAGPNSREDPRADRDLPLRLSGRGEIGKRSGNNARNDSGLIRIEQIFDVNKNGEIPTVDEEKEETEKPKRIRIEGPPGIGKSIQCRKLACDWASDSFQQFDFAFLLQMRYFDGDVKDAIFDQLLPEDTDIDREALWSYIRQVTNQPKVLFILDGLDELKPQVRQTSDVIKLIQQRVLTDATVVITSRPHECTADLNACPLHCNIRGFTKANSQEYIHKYFRGRPELANSLGARIARDKNLAELATNPLNTMLLCILWEDNDGSLPSTITGLFSSLVLCIVKRYCSKNEIAVTGTTIPSEVYTQLAEMGKVAWEGLLRNEVNFDEAAFQSTDSGMEMFKFGFLTKDLGASRIEASFVWSFLHKTFQEYFAAVCLSKDADMQEGVSGSVPTGSFAFIPRQLYLVDPRVRQLQAQANASLTESGRALKDRVLQLLKNDHLRQVCLFLVGILKSRSKAVFACFRSHLQTLRNSGENDAKDEHRLLLLFCIKCLIESENGSSLVRVLSPCFPKAIDVSDLFGHAYDETWRLGLILILNAEFPGVTRVDINLSSHPMTTELAAALARNRFVRHLSIIRVDVSVTSYRNIQVPLLNVLERTESIGHLFAQIYGIRASDRDLAPMTKLLRAVSLCKPLSSLILKLFVDDRTYMGDLHLKYGCPPPLKLYIPVELLASSSTLTTCKLWIYGSFQHHYRIEYDVYESEGGGVYRKTDDELDHYMCERVDDQDFNESIGKLLRESKTIQTFSLQMMYRCIVFRHADKLPRILAKVLAVTEVLQHIVLRFSFYHKQRDRGYPITYSELTRLHIFRLIEALAHNRTLGIFELSIDDDACLSRHEDDSSNEEDGVDSSERPCQAESNQNQPLRSSRLRKTDQDRLWPSIASVFQNNTVLHTLNLTFKYCLTDSSESVQRMADAVLALSGNSTLHTVKVAVILYRAQTDINLGLNASVSGIGNVDEVFYALGNVVSTNTTLERLHFHKADDPWRQACRERSFTELAQSDECWHSTVSKPAIEQIASAIQRNIVLRELSIEGFTCEDEGVQEVVDEMLSSARDDLNITFSLS